MFVVNSAGFDETSTIIVTLEVIQYLNHWRIQDFPGGVKFFCRKLHENERIWTPRGACVPGAPFDLPMLNSYSVPL